MAPLRASRTTRSTRPGAQSDVDIIDGLPVRQWRIQEVYINPTLETNPDNALAANAHSERPILPNGRPELALPQGSNAYTPWCKQILKIARSGKLGKRKERDDEHEDEKENGDQDEAADAAKMGFTARKWGPLPRSMEVPEREYLAPRRAGLPKPGAGVSQVSGPNGEVMANGVATDEPSRRRMPPPRRKPKKGPGRRKKMTEGDGMGVSASAEALEGANTGDDTPNANGEHRSGADGTGDENGEDEEEGDEGEEGADDDREEGELSDEKEEESKELLSRFKGDTAQDIVAEAEVRQRENVLPPPAAPEPMAVDMPPLPGLGQPVTDGGREEGELDADEEEEDYEPPPPKPADEDDEGDYEPPPPVQPPPIGAPQPPPPLSPPEPEVG